MVVQCLCDGLYGYDTVWSAKRIFHPSRATVHHYDVDEEQLMVSYGGKKDLLLTAAYLHLQIMKKTRQKEEGCLDERLVAAHSALWSV